MKTFPSNIMGDESSHLTEIILDCVEVNSCEPQEEISENKYI